MTKALKYSFNSLCSVLLLAAMFGTTNCRGQGSNTPMTKPHVSSARTMNAMNSREQILCPPAGVSSVQGSGHHKVRLSWIASPSAARPGRDVFGYCLYRSKKRGAAKHDPLCTTCERINSVPVKSISCIDDLVEDNTKYYYVVTAINKHRNISRSSEEAAAPIPTADRVGPAPASSVPPPPSCRDLPRD